MNKLILLLIIFVLTIPLKSQVKIKMTKENGVFTMPCTVNGLKLKFIFDTGASKVCISLSEAYFMLKNGLLNESDIYGSSYSQIANGNIVENSTVKLREIEISGVKLNNVEAVIIHELSAPLLLGQSALQKFGRIQIDGDELILLDIKPFIQKTTNNYIPESAIKFYNKASTAYIDENYSLAIENYNKAIAIYPEYTIAYFEMGNLYDDINNYVESIKCFQKVIMIEPGNSAAYNNLGSAYESISKYNEALENYQKAVKLNSNFAGTYNNIGNVYLKLGKTVQAFKHFQKAVEIDPSYYVAHYNLAKLYSKLGDKNEEIRCYIRAARLGHSESQDFLTKLGLSWE